MKKLDLGHVQENFLFPPVLWLLSKCWLPLHMYKIISYLFDHGATFIIWLLLLIISHKPAGDAFTKVLLQSCLCGFSKISQMHKVRTVHVYLLTVNRLSLPKRKSDYVRYFHVIIWCLKDLLPPSFIIVIATCVVIDSLQACIVLTENASRMLLIIVLVTSRIMHVVRDHVQY